MRTLQASLQKNEKKFSIIVYGVSECPEGTSKPDQSSHDFGEITSFLLKVDSSIQPQSIKDIQYTLGKYHHERPRPRPILVKFLRSADVSNVLAKRSLIQPPYSVKPYLSKEEQRCESALLKERWSLIQSGTSRESIKISAEIVKLLLDKDKVIINQQDQFGCYPLKRAIKYLPDIVQLLLDRGADPNQDDGGETPLMSSVYDVNIAKMLIASEANVNLQSNNGGYVC